MTEILGWVVYCVEVLVVADRSREWVDDLRRTVFLLAAERARVGHSVVLVDHWHCAQKKTKVETIIKEFVT